MCLFVGMRYTLAMHGMPKYVMNDSLCEWFSPTLWVLGIELRLSGLDASAFFC